jgi:PelA/Pel-15E family pectate lyase
MFLAAMLLAQQPSPYLEGFRDSSSHWQKKRDRVDYPQHPPNDVRAIADNVLLLQRRNGGWPPNEEILRILTPQDREQWASEHSREDTSFDNRTTYTHWRYLAHAYQVTRDPRFRDGALRGIEFTLQAESPLGGWPHSFPRTGSYYRHITIMDDVTVGVLQALRQASLGQEPFNFLPSDLRDRCAQAVERGTSLLLRCQVSIDGQKTIWAGQYDETTLQPCQARSFEPPALTASESVAVVEYLMSLPDPSPPIQQAIESAVSWYRNHQLRGFRIDQVPAPEERFSEHVSRFDRIEVIDPQAPPLWARFYDLRHSQPFLCDRDGKIVYHFAELSRERRTGYRWYGSFATALLERDYPTWKKRADHAP